MALAHLIGEIVRYNSFFPGKAAVVKWGLLIITITVPALLFFIVKRKRKAKETTVLLCNNRRRDTVQKNASQWEKGKKRIEKLLYEITDRMHPDEYMKSQSDLTDNKRRHYYDVPVYGHTNRILRERNMTINSRNESGTPLDIRELEAVSTLAKQLQARSHHNIRT